MNREQKKEVVKQLGEKFSASQASFIVGYKGLTVLQMQGLRNELREKGGSLMVAKARLMKLAVQDLGNCKDLAPVLKNQIGVVFSNDQPPAVAKVLDTFAKANEALELVAGCLDGKMLDSEGIRIIAQLPSREILLSQICFALNMPVTKLATVLNASILQLLMVLKQVEEKKQ